MKRWVRPATGAIAAAAIGFVSLLTASQPARAWGPEAHRVIALIADQHLQKTAAAARAKVTALLAADKSDKLVRNTIADEATWADVLADKSQEAHTATAAWHSTRLDAANPDLGAACFGHKPLPSGYPAAHGPQDNCSVDKIEQFEAELRDPSTSSFERLAALQFLLNLVADVNDPLHAIDHGDRGGECVAVQIGAKPPVRLATLWDELLVHEAVGGNPSTAAARIAGAIPAADAAKWEEGNPATWARDSYDVAKSVTYGFTADKPAGTVSFPAPKGQPEACASIPLYKVGPDYEAKAAAAVRTQIAKAGIRLARVLRDSLK